MIHFLRNLSIKCQSFLLLLVLFFLYGVFSQFFEGILPIHEWRKTDSLSIALNYMKGTPFLEPQTQWISDHGTRNAVAEFPIIYFIIGKLWALFGYHEWIVKVLSILLLFIAISLLSEVMEFLFGQKRKALLFSFMIGSSPVLIYYADSILPNVYSFSFVLLGAFGTFKFLRTKQVFWLGFLTFFFVLAVLLKITALLALLTFSGAWLLYTLVNQLSSLKSQAFFWLSFIFAFIVILTATFLWYGFAMRYNQSMGSELFSTTIRPIWEVDAATRRAIWEKFWKHMLPGLYHPSILLLSVLFLVFAIWKRWLEKYLLWLVIVGLIGLFSYFALWFWVFDVHDYYLIEALYFPLILYYILLKYRSKILPAQKRKTLLSIAWISLVFLQAISYAHWSFGKENLLTKNTPFVSQYVKGNWGYFHFYHREHLGQLQENTKEIQLLIPENDTIICLSDPSPNVHLYTLNRIGFSQYSFHEPFHDETTQIYELIQKGARFAILIMDPNQELRKDWKPFLSHRLYQKGNIYVYDLSPYRRKN